jgi:hypothetical protein
MLVAYPVIGLATRLTEADFLWLLYAFTGRLIAHAREALAGSGRLIGMLQRS